MFGPEDLHAAGSTGRRRPDHAIAGQHAVHATLVHLTGDSLRAATSLAASAETPTVTLPPSSVGVVWMDVALGSQPVPAAITHRVAIDPPADIPTSGIAWNFTGPAVKVDQ